MFALSAISYQLSAISYQLSAIGYRLCAMMVEMFSRPISIRRELEEPADLGVVRAVNRAAFGGDVEADLVARLWVDGEVLFGLVAEVEGQPVGHILFSCLPITRANGDTIGAAALAPLAVLPDYQRQGVGSALVQYGLDLCRERGLPLVVVLGDPAYYTRFGFRAETASGLETPWSGPYLMAIELVPGSLGDGKGAARYPRAFTELP